MAESSKTSQVPSQVAPTLSHGAASAPDSSLADALGGTFGAGAILTEVTPPNVPGYDLIRELGRGGMGVVYLAREIALNRLVALKLMTSVGAAADLARFRAEAEAVAALRHPNIVQIYAIGEANGRPFVALEYVEGGTFAQQLHGLPCNPHTAAALLVTLAETIHFAHSRGIVHRDLKPSNILVSPSGIEVAAPLDSGLRRLHPHGLKIADFGLAKRMDQADSQTKTGLVMGTPEYMAPEQAAGRSRLIGPAADIYALGAVMYETLTGRPPHRGILPMDTLLQVLNDEPVRPSRLVSNLPRDLETICLKCLEKDPARRYATAHDLAADLRRFLKDQPIVARPLGRVGRAWRWCRRNRLAAAGLTAAGLSFVVGSAASLAFGLLALNRAAEAEAARAAEFDAKGRAQRQYNLTRDTVDQLLPLALTLRVSQDVNLGRKQALELAVAMYDKLSQEAPEDADLHAKATDLRLQLGLVLNELQLPAEALPYLERARLGFEQLARREPTNYHFRYQEASAAYNRGQSLRVLGRPREALDHMALAVTRWQTMLVDLPAKDVPRTLENAHLLMALVCLEDDDAPGARASLSQAERFNTLPAEPWQIGGINELQRARRLALQGRLDLWDRRPAQAVQRLRQALQDWAVVEQKNKQIQVRTWEKLAMRVELARAMSLAGELPAARRELDDALRQMQEPTLGQSAYLLTALHRVRGLRLRARLEALEDPATAAATLADAEQVAMEMCRASTESAVHALEWLRVLNDQLEGLATPPTEAERERLRTAIAENLSRLEATADATLLQRERQRLQMATAPVQDSASALSWTKWLPEETAVDAQLRLWSVRPEWSAAEAGALDRLLAAQGERAQAGDRLARVNVAAALVLSAQRHPEHRIASLRQALAALTELQASAPECWELRLRLTLAADLLADATGNVDDRTRAEQARAHLPPHAQRLLRRWPEPALRPIRSTTTIPP